MLSDDEVRLRFGDDVLTSRRAGFVLVHLDRPAPTRIRERTEGFDPDAFFDPECPLCEIQRSQGLVVFDDYGDEPDEEILLE